MKKIGRAFSKLGEQLFKKLEGDSQKAVLLIGAGALFMFASSIVTRSLRFELGALLFIIIVLSLLAISNAARSKRIEEMVGSIQEDIRLYKNLGLRRFDLLENMLLDASETAVEFIPVSHKNNTNVIFHETAELIKQAETSIYVLNSFAEEKPGAGEAGADPRPEYFQELERAMSRVNEYVRIIQADESEDIKKRYHKHYLDHFRNVISLHQRMHRGHHDKKIVARRVARTYPTTFVIVDDKTVAWQLNEIEPAEKEDPRPTSERIRIRGLVILKGKANSKEVKIFRNWFHRAEGRSKPLKKSDLDSNNFILDAG